ncbi:copper homeostasis membrane protein CopD [Pseudomonas sp. Fl5BN2]|uniref:copper homeostasis membrane protein CopD n=1 Tax=Pseudomonas sp. Fl5BN2 TaxID=2697652 RepID=UPI0013782AB0|nr:copper homeostasis membrane protein CopD [Pseudomonas sp. Fl5BN2]NBF02108.1 copper homeostasis membrane protein CopD [Pseudomonas sp. Fl5BN2]
MDDFLNLGLRLALYLDLLVLFGVALFGLYSLNEEERQDRRVLPFRDLLLAASWLGGLLSLAWLLQTGKVMSGVEQLHQLPLAQLQALVLDTDTGVAWTLRIVALTLAGCVATGYQRRPSASLWCITLAATLAVSTLAWAGHGAMDQGPRRYLHLGNDILHLLAAGAWLGALLAFVLQLRRSRGAERPQVLQLARSLNSFERLGAVLVLSLSLSGVINFLLIVGASLEVLRYSLYGQLLSLKVTLFGAMLLCAALNRQYLSPRLQQALADGDPDAAMGVLRRSLQLELLLALLVFGLVAWLGTLSPELPGRTE